MDFTRRKLFGVLAGAVAAPIVARSAVLMPVKAFKFSTAQDYSWEPIYASYRALLIQRIINPPLVLGADGRIDWNMTRMLIEPDLKALRHFDAVLPA